MRVRVTTIAAICFMAFFSSFAVAETTEQQFLRTIHEFHMARSDVTLATASFGLMLNKSLDKDFEVAALRDSMNRLNVAADGYSKASAALSGFIAKNAGKLKGNAVAEWAQKELTPSDTEKLTKFSTAVTEFVSSIREVEFTVFANEDWANSSLSVSETDYFSIKQDGQWTVSSGYPATNHQGYLCEGKSPYRVLADAPLGALIYRVRGAGSPNPMALNDGKGASTGKGRLEFMINDSDRRNNQGQLNLKIVAFDGEKLKALGKLDLSGN